MMPVSRLFALVSLTSITFLCSCGVDPQLEEGDENVPENPAPSGDPANVIDEGLTIWRKSGDPNKDNGAACANCHSPDGLDLAYFDFSKGAILRRGEPHVGKEDAAKIAAMIEAVRDKYQITEPKDFLLDRPFQPGGAVLPGASVQERDLAFGRQLQDMGYRFATVPVLNIEEALIQKEEWLSKVDPRTLKIGMPLNRWSEDPHRGEEHASIADWLPDLGFMPSREVEEDWYALHDLYLENPTDENFMLMYDAVEAYTDHPFQGNGKSLMLKKYKSVLVAQHMFRQELTEGSLFGERPTSAFFPLRMAAKKPKGYNPIWEVGDFARVNSKDEELELPKEIMERIEGSNKEAMKQVKVPWFYTGWLFDQGLQKTSKSNSTKSAEYFSHFFQDDFSEGQPNRSGYSIHNIFMITRKQMVHNFDPVATEGTPARLAVAYSNFHGYGWDVKKAPKDSQERLDIYQFMVENSYRMMLFLIQEDIKQKGKPIPENTAKKWNSALDRMEGFFTNLPSQYEPVNLKLVQETREMMM